MSLNQVLRKCFVRKFFPRLARTHKLMILFCIFEKRRHVNLNEFACIFTNQPDIKVSKMLFFTRIKIGMIFSVIWNVWNKICFSTWTIKLITFFGLVYVKFVRKWDIMFPCISKGYLVANFMYPFVRDIKMWWLFVLKCLTNLL